VKFEIVGAIENQKTIATGNAIREVNRLKRIYGKGRWRKCKGIAMIRFDDGSTRRAEIHWYEATGIEKKEFKIKYLLD
jgi:hypothetical protein